VFQSPVQPSVCETCSFERIHLLSPDIFLRVIHGEFVHLLFLQSHRETDRFFAASGFQLPQPTSGLFHYHLTAFSSQLKAKVGNTVLTKSSDLRINLNIDGSPIASQSHTHPSHSQASEARLLTSSLSLGVPGPRTTQCIRDV
jgi:hypothetical protein